MSGDSTTLRPVEERDLELLLAWRSHPDVYEHFREQDGPLRWEEHVEWFRTRSPERHDYVIEYEGRRVGSVAVTEDDEVSVYVGEVTLWGEGVARDALELLWERVDSDVLYAEIHEDNEGSQRLFETCSYERIGSEGAWIKYRRSR